MRNHLFIFIFNILLFVVGFFIFLAPVLVAENKLVPAYSGQAAQIKLVERALSADASGGRKKVLLLGDSTVRNIHPLIEAAESDPYFVNMAAGGSVSLEWFHILRKAVERLGSFRGVVVGMSNGQALQSSADSAAYYPFILNLSDFWGEYRSGRMTAQNALRSAVYSKLRILVSKDDVLYRVVGDALPVLRPLLMDQLVHQKEKESLRLSTPGGGAPKDPDDSIVGIRKLVELAKKESIPLYFVMSPAAKAVREAPYYREMKAMFVETCLRMKLSCADFSSRLPDQYFSDDRVHLRPEYNPHLRALIEGLLKRDHVL